MAESRSALIVIIGVTFLGVVAATMGISVISEFIEGIALLALLGIPIWLLVRWVKQGRVIVQCRGCAVKMTWKNFRNGGRFCPACFSDLCPADTGEREPFWNW